MEKLRILEIGFTWIFAPSFKNFPEGLSIQSALSIFLSFKSSVAFENLILEESKSRKS